MKKTWKKVFSLGLAAVLTLMSGMPSVHAAESKAVEVAEIENLKLDGTRSTALKNTTKLQEKITYSQFAERIENGSFTFRYKMDEAANGNAIACLMSISSGQKARNYASIYLQYVNNACKIGLELQKSKNADASAWDSASMVFTCAQPVKFLDSRWHTITVNFQNYEISAFLDGVALNGSSAQTRSVSALLNQLLTDAQNPLNTIGVGGAIEPGNLRYPTLACMDKITVAPQALAEAEIKTLHDKTVADVTPDLSDVTPSINDLWKKGKPMTAYNFGQSSSVDVSCYRIPSLVKSGNRLVAAADARKFHWNDWGDIATVVKTSEDNGVTWSENHTVVDLATQPYFVNSNVIKDERPDGNLAYNHAQSGIMIDPVLLSCKDDRTIFLLVDACPESKGAIDCDYGSGYELINGKYYQNLYDALNNKYTVRENGVVYDANGQRTNYTVEEGSADTAYSTKGNLKENGIDRGNIYLNGTESGNKSAPLKVKKSNYLWLFKSEDSGSNWSFCQDVTPFVKKDWMKFIGTGPGAGIEVQKADGGSRLVFPVYYTNGKGNVLGRQSSANIYSDDGGETWQLGGSPNDGRIVNGTAISSQTYDIATHELTESQIVQLKDGRLVQVMRNTSYYDQTRDYGVIQYAISSDYGKTWSQVYDTDIREPFCQLSAISADVDTDGDGVKEECIIISNANGNTDSSKANTNSKKARQNGYIRICQLKADDRLEVVHERLVQDKNFAYSSLAMLDDGKNIGMLYEHDNDINYMKLGLEFIMDKTVHTEDPNILGIEVEGIDSNVVTAGTRLPIKVTFDQPIFLVSSQERALKLLVNGVEKNAAYVSGSGTSELNFEYTVEAGATGDIITDMTFPGGIISSVYGNVLNTSSSSTEKILKYIDVDPTIATRDLQLKDAGGTGGLNQNASWAKDGIASTYWASNAAEPWLCVLLKNPSTVDGIRYLPRQNSADGRITQYEVWVSKAENWQDTASYTRVSTGTWPPTKGWQAIKFTPQEDVRHVKLIIKDSNKTGSVKIAAAAELCVTGERVIKTDLKAEAVARYNTTRLSWSEITDATEFVIERAESENGSYTKVAELAADEREYFDECGFEKNYYYRITAYIGDDKVSEQIVHDRATGMEAVKKHALIDKTFDNTLFDGSRVETLNDSNPSVKNLSKGSIIIKYKMAPQMTNGVLFGINPWNAAGGNNSVSISILDGCIRQVFSPAGSQLTVQSNNPGTDEWHTAVFSANTKDKTMRITVDGKELFATTNTTHAGFLSHLTNVTGINVGGQSGNANNFQGRIAYVMVSGEVLTDSEAIAFTEKENEWVDVADKTELTAAIKKAYEIKTDLYTNASIDVFKTAIDEAVNISDEPTSPQSDVDAATEKLLAAMEQLVLLVDTDDKLSVVSKVVLPNGADSAAVGFLNLEKAAEILKKEAYKLELVEDTLILDDYVEIVAESEDLDTVPDDVKEKFEKYINDKNVKLHYFDLSIKIRKKQSIDGESKEIGEITEISEAIEFEKKLESLAGSKNLKVYRMHNGKVDTVTSARNSDRITFKSNRFSTYAIGVKEETAPNVDKSKLNQAIRNAESKNKSLYTAKSYAAMQTALKAAQNVSANGKATQSEVNKAADTLNKAIKELVKKAAAPATPTQPVQKTPEAIKPKEQSSVTIRPATKKTAANSTIKAAATSDKQRAELWLLVLMAGAMISLYIMQKRKDALSR